MLYTHNGVTGLSYIGRLHWEFVDVNRANHGRWLHVVLLTLFFFLRPDGDLACVIAALHSLSFSFLRSSCSSPPQMAELPLSGAPSISYTRA